MGDVNLINLRELSKPAELLIEKISDAVGILYEPTRIRRKAKAEADADVISATASLDVSDIKCRALYRIEQEQLREQMNIEAVTFKAFAHLDAASDPSLIDNDWLTEFFIRSRRVSNEHMQEIWGQLLAGEVNNPNSVSKRTLDFVSLMDRSEAEMFEKICRFRLTNSHIIILFTTYDPILENIGLSYSDIAHLDSIGLIQISEGSGFMTLSDDSVRPVEIAGQSVEIDLLQTPEKSNYYLARGAVRFTRTGKDLQRFVTVDPVEEFYDYCAKNWEAKGFKLLDKL